MTNQTYFIQSIISAGLSRNSDSLAFRSVSPFICFSFVIDSDLHLITTNYSGKLPYDEQHMVDAYRLYRVYVVAMNTCSNITAQNTLIYSTVY